MDIKQICFECGGNATEKHHVIPKSLGGTKTVSLCGDCHSKVHNLGTRRDQHTELTRAALQHKKSNNERIGQIPFGYKLDADGIHLIENEREQKIINIVLSLRERGYTYKSIASELERRQLKNKANRVKWNITQVSRIIKKAS